MGKREPVALYSCRDCCVAIPRGAVGVSVVCDCGISRSYSFTILCTWRLFNSVTYTCTKTTNHENRLIISASCRDPAKIHSLSNIEAAAKIHFV